MIDTLDLEEESIRAEFGFWNPFVTFVVFVTLLGIWIKSALLGTLKSRVGNAHWN